MNRSDFMKLTEAYSFKWNLFTKNYMFELDDFGFVLEKEPQVVCLYVTDRTHTEIFAAMPICPPNALKKATFAFSPVGNNRCSFTISQIDFRFFVDFEKRCCANNRNLKVYGSPMWGENPQVKWEEWV